MKRNGTDCLVYVDVSSTPTAIAGSTENTLTVNGEVIDVTTKDSQGWRDLMAGLASWSISGAGKFDDAAAFGYSDLLALLVAKAPVTIRMSFEESGVPYWTGEAIITSLELAAPLEDAVTFSYTFEGTGVLTEA